MFLAMVCIGCATVNRADNNELSYKLDFKNCTPELGLKAIKISIDKNYRKKKTEDFHGYCEYRFFHSGGSIIYFSSHIYDGSVLNYENRLNASIDTYSTNRSIADTIRVSGQEKDGTYWMEWIRGNHVVGYVNCIDTVELNNILSNIEVICSD